MSVDIVDIPNRYAGAFLRDKGFSRENPNPSLYVKKATKDSARFPSGWVWVTKDNDFNKGVFVAPPPSRGESSSSAKRAGTASKKSRETKANSREVLNVNLGNEFRFLDAGKSPGDGYELVETSDPRTPTGWVWMGKDTGKVYQAPYQEPSTSSADETNEPPEGSELSGPRRTRQTTSARRQAAARQRTLASVQGPRRTGTILGE